MTDTYIAPALVDQGYTGSTAGTPYKPATASQLSTLQAASATSFTGQVTAAAPNAIHLNINFDGTQNNGLFPAKGESSTNVWQLKELQILANPANKNNTIYLSGIGAQTVPSDALDANGHPAPGSSPSMLESTPWKAGAIGNSILKEAYDKLTTRVNEILATNPTAQIALNLGGFSRGSAEAVAFANLLNERGIPGLYEPGHVPVNSMVLYDPVNQTGGTLNVTWPTNVQNTLVLAALNEGRAIMPAMPVGANAIVIGIPGAHADIGGSFNPNGISAVTLKIAQEFLKASGVPVADIPSHLRPDWRQMQVHNSGLDNYGNVTWEFSEGNRYYEGGGWKGIAVQDMLGRNLRLDPVFDSQNGRREFVGFRTIVSEESVNAGTGARTRTQDITTFNKDGVTRSGRKFESVTENAVGLLADQLVVNYKSDGITIVSTSLTVRQPDNSLQTTVRDDAGKTLSVTIAALADNKGGGSGRHHNLRRRYRLHGELYP